MSSANPLVRVFIDQYEHAGETLDFDVIAAEYTDSFTFAGPNGARVIEKDKLLRALSGRQAFFKALGQQSTRITFLDETDLDNHNVLYWSVCNS